MKNLHLILLFILTINVYSQHGGEYKINYIVGKEKYSLVNTKTNQEVFKNYMLISEIYKSFYVLIKNKKIEIFNSSLGKIVFSGDTENNLKNYKYIEGKKLIEIQTQSGIKLFSFDKSEIIFPKDETVKIVMVYVFENATQYLQVAFENIEGVYRYGLIDSVGKEILPMQYDFISNYDIKNNIFIVNRHKKYGVVDGNNKIIIPFNYNFLTVIDGFYLAEIDQGKAGIITIQDTVLPFSFEKGEYNGNKLKGRKPFYTNGIFTLAFEGDDIEIDTSKKILNEVNQYLKSYKTRQEFNFRYNEFEKNNLKGFYNTETKEITVPAEYYHFDLTNDKVLFKGGIGAEKNGKWGMVNIETGKIMIPFEYNVPYLNDAIHTKDAFSTKFIIKQKKTIADTTVYLILKKKGLYGVVDLSGKVLLPFIYDDIDNYYSDCRNKHLVIVKKDGLYGLIDDTSLKEILPCIYEEIEYCTHIKKLKSDKKMGNIKNHGEIDWNYYD